MGHMGGVMLLLKLQVALLLLVLLRVADGVRGGLGITALVAGAAERRVAQVLSLVWMEWCCMVNDRWCNNLAKYWKKLFPGGLGQFSWRSMAASQQLGLEMRVAVAPLSAVIIRVSPD